jgi:hypothetical protein
VVRSADAAIWAETFDICSVAPASDDADPSMVATVSRSRLIAVSMA